jgi:5-methylcytosine-specific restriction protein A
LAKGYVTAATEVDHIQAHRGDARLMWDFENNVQSLCKPCHSKKTVKEDGGLGRERKQH